MDLAWWRIGGGGWNEGGSIYQFSVDRLISALVAPCHSPLPYVFKRYLDRGKSNLTFFTILIAHCYRSLPYILWMVYILPTYLIYFKLYSDYLLKQALYRVIYKLTPGGAPESARGLKLSLAIKVHKINKKEFKKFSVYCKDFYWNFLISVINYLRFGSIRRKFLCALLHNFS